MPKSAPERLTASIATGEIGAPERCVHIGDRASDIYELFCLAQDLGANFLVRGCVDHLAEAGGTTIAQVMQDTPPSGMHQIRLRDASGLDRPAHLVVKFATMVVRPPIGKHKFYVYQSFMIVHAEGADPTADRRPLFWKPIASLNAAIHADAVYKPGWYVRRWSIETFFKSLSPTRRSAPAPLRSARSASKIASMRFTASSVVARSTAPERGRRHAGIRSSRSMRLNGDLVA